MSKRFLENQGQTASLHYLPKTLTIENTAAKYTAHSSLKPS